MWDREPVPDNREYLFIHEIPRPATKHLQPVPATPSLKPDKGLPDTPPQQLKQVEVPPELELMELDVQDNIADWIDVPKDIVSDFEAWAHNVQSYQF